eukprot:TRINITY_DN65731_c0_g1_i1.p1 TRINITY_DN65731_c0_g1~~TRINITY_DN65731_c0_g1_i1.p1  ORF type:complete len:560 (-),score=128.39 TRINITY_DN65731_c0_g1_i1:51-1730(-)
MYKSVCRRADRWVAAPRRRRGGFDFTSPERRLPWMASSSSSGPVPLQRIGNGPLKKALEKPELRHVVPYHAEGRAFRIPTLCCEAGNRSLVHQLKEDVENCGEAYGLHRSGKHLQVFGDALKTSTVFKQLVSQLLAAFEVSLVDCWVNVYRGGDDMKAWHHDNYQDRSPRPNVTVMVSLGATREFAIQNIHTGQETRIALDNGDVFAFDDAFNRDYKHGVPPETGVGASADSLRISIVVWANEMASVPTVVRDNSLLKGKKQDVVPLKVHWSDWDFGRHCQRPSQGAPTAGAEQDAADKKQAPAAVSFYGHRWRNGGSHSNGGGYTQPDGAAPWADEGSSSLRAGPATTAEDAASAAAAAASSLAPKPVAKRWSAYSSMQAAQDIGSASDAAASASSSCAATREALEAAAEAADRALTLQGAQQVLSIIRGKKLIENRAWKIPLGWHALHCGAQTITPERAERVREVWPDAPAEDTLPHRAIYGLFYVEEHLTPEDCRPGYVWARGPICHMVSKAIELPRPVSIGGDKGLWLLNDGLRRQIREQISEATLRTFDLSVAR